MNVLYVSKALVTAEYRMKIRELGGHACVRAVMPERWGAAEPEPSPAGVPEPARVPARLTGHNHLHHYMRPDRWLTEPRPDLAHIDEEPYSLVTLQLGRLCRRQGLPFVFFAWQNVARRLPPPFGAVRRAVLRRAAGGIAGTARAAGVLTAAGFNGPLAVIPQFGVDPERFRPDPGARREVRQRYRIPAAAFVAGYAGRLVPEKGVESLVRAFAALEGDRDAPPPHLLLIGDGPDRGPLEAMVRRAGVADRVRFAGRVPSTVMPDTLNALDALVLPSIGTRTWAEQFGRVLVEAMACGVAVIGTATGEIPAVIGNAGAVVPPDDAAALAKALAELRAVPALREVRADAGLRRVRDRFTHAGIARDTAAFYRHILGREAAA